MSVHGLDWAWWNPTEKTLTDLDCNFACRYLSHSPDKNLTKVEANRLASWGVWLVVVWETTANRAKAGTGAGVNDAATAAAQAKACGMPDDRPIYFAVDFDATSLTQIRNYFEGVVTVLGLERVGVYGSYDVVRWLDLNQLATYLWQTYAWSGGRFYTGNHIEQYSNGNTYDHDRALKADYGQWMPGVSPEGADMALTDADVAKIAKATAEEVWAKDNHIDSPASAQAYDAAHNQPVNTHWKGESYMTGMYAQNELILATLSEVNAKLATLSSPAAADAVAIVNELATRLTPAPVVPPTA